MNSTLLVYTAAAALVLDLNDTAAGYRTVALPDAERVWDQEWAESPYADGAQLAAPERLGLVSKQLRTRIRGASWAQVEERFEAMLTAIEQAPPWLLVIGKGGIDRTWRAAGRASSSSPDSSADVLNRTRLVSWTVPAQPAYTITGLEP